MKTLRNLWKEEEGQDLIEYTLLLGFVALAGAAIFAPAASNITGIWTSASTVLVSANTAAGS